MSKPTAIGTIEMVRDKDCKGCVRYAVPKDEQDGSQAATNVYVMKVALNDLPEIPEKIVVQLAIAA